MRNGSGTPREPMAVTSSLNSIHISPRTPRTPRTHRPNIGDDEEEDVELSLLNEEERLRSAGDFQDHEPSLSKSEDASKLPISAKDKRGMALLCVLYLLQGIPLGLALGSVPFLLKEHLSYSQLGTFALSSYPYSLKLLWSPIVDSLYFKSFGRRKSWIVPMQLIVGSLMLYISLNVQRLMDDPANNVYELTTIFTLLVTFSATQDIAVDGWALTLLSQDCLSYASTCQTIGLNTGFFASFTVFLAFNSEAFAQKWGVPHLTLSGYLRFWSVICYAVTLWLVFFKKEDKEPANDADMSIKAVYKTIWEICRLKHVQLLIIVHLFAKIGFAANDAATGLKLVEKGFKREDLAIVVLIDFPFQIMGGWLAAKWSRGDRPLRPWIYAFWPRLLFALMAALIVYWFPKSPISTGFFLLLVVHTVLSSFASTVQFVGISAFHTRVSDPLIGGTYMTLLNTFTNMGGTWPKWFVLKGIDLFSVATCKVAGAAVDIHATECVSDHGKAVCKDINGVCITETDGYYVVTGICIGFGILFLVAFIIPTARKLQKLPTSTLQELETPAVYALNLEMSTTTMHFGPEWMRTKHQPLPRSQPPPSPPPTVPPSAGLSTYSALVSATPPAPSESTDDAHPFRYSKEELLKIYQEGGGKGGLGLEVERWEGVVREAGAEPITLREMTEAEKKLFAGPLNSEMRRRPSQSTEFLSPLATSSLDRPRLSHNPSSNATNSPLRERFGGLKRRDSAAGTSEPAMPAVLRKPSLSALQTPISPREAPRQRVGYTPSFDGVLNSGESWMARRRVSETPTKPGGGPSREVSEGHQDNVSASSGIREDKENDRRRKVDSRASNDLSTMSSSSPQVHTEEPRLYSLAAVTGTENSLQSSSTAPAAVNGIDDVPKPVGDLKDVGPPPGLVDLAAVEWSYKDPTGQVQGPFRADLMQKWYNDGYFTADLPVKRVRYDTQWITVAELLQRSNGENIFLSSPAVLTQPTRVNGSPSHILPSHDHGINEPLQPAPIRSLRASNLESYLSSGSLTSDSRSSSVGASQFGNSSPDPAAFGGRDSQLYMGRDLDGRLSAFASQERHMAFNERRTMGLDFQTHPVHNNIRGPAFTGFIPERDLGFNAYPYNAGPIPQDPWGMSPNISSPAFVGARDQEIDRSFPLSNPLPTELGATHRQPDIANGLLSRTYDHSTVFSSEEPGHIRVNRNARSDIEGINYGSYDFGGQASFPNTQDQPAQYSSPAGEYADGSNMYPFSQNVAAIPESSVSSSIPSAPWAGIPDTSPSSHLASQAESLQSLVTPVSASGLSSQSPWQHVEQSPTIPQVSEALAQSSLDEQDAQWRTEGTAHGDLGQDSQQEDPSIEVAAQKVGSPGQSSQPPPESISSSSPPASGTTVSKKASKPLQANNQITRPTPAEPAVTNVVQKTAWIKEDEGKKKAAANVSVSLREIQEAEAKKLEAKKAAEREKERLARIAASAETKDDIQPFVASWGLPTSQAGSRASVPARETPVTAGPSPPAAPVWTAALKQPAVKKTMKEIQEEEEVRKKMAASKESPAVAPKRPYAETTNKVGTTGPPSSNSAWTTVGPNGKTSAAAAPSPTRPPAQSSTSRLSVPSVQKPAATATVKPKPPPKQEELLESPSHDFLKWLTDALKGLNSSVNVEEIVSMLLSFPLDPDALTLEIISDTIYSNSTTLDGRRFASEFVAKRKADATARKGASLSGKAPMKPVSIADVVKATPKTPQPEWGFKVVNKKKKGGRS